MRLAGYNPMKGRGSAVRMHSGGEDYQDARSRAMSGLRNEKFPEEQKNF